MKKFRRVFEEQKKKSKKDLKELQVKIEENEVRKYTKTGWNKLINEAAENIAFKIL